MSATDPARARRRVDDQSDSVAADSGPGMPDSRIRPIAPADVRGGELVHDLAAYEKLRELCHLTDDQLHAALFGPSPALFGLVADAEHGAVASVSPCTS